MASKKGARERHLDVVRRNREAAKKLVDAKGRDETRKLLEDAARDLRERIGASGKGTFTAVHARQLLAQVEDSTRLLVGDAKDLILDGAREASELGANQVVDALQSAHEAYGGLGEHGLALDEAGVLDAALKGSRATALRRLAPSEDAGPGILARYGMQTVAEFEKVLQRGVITNASREEMVDQVTERSPFLQGAPRFWAERIVRTEVQHALNSSAADAIDEANDQLGDVVQILSATFDDRTAWDSYMVHGQIRRVGEPFTWNDYKGVERLFIHPPARPNDREIVVPHRISWEIPSELRALPSSAYRSKFRETYPRRSPPRRPLMTTVPISRFGADSAQ